MSLNRNMFRYMMDRINISVTQLQIRSFPRWSYRRPVQAIAPEDYDEYTDKKKPTTEEITEDMVQENLLSKTKIKWKQPNQHVSEENHAKEQSVKFAIKPSVRPLVLKKSNLIKHTTVDMLETTIDQDGNFIYTKMGDNDLRISNIMVEVKSKREKTKKDLMLLEGKRLIKDALDAKCNLEYLLFSRLKDVEYLRSSLPRIGAKLFKMPYRDMQMWSNLTTNPGIMGIFKIPDTEEYEPLDALPLTIICDNLREPSNLGAVLRTASALGCKEMLLTKGCVSLWDTKVLRAACGGHFKLRLKNRLEWQKIQEELTPNASIFIADNKTTIESAEASQEFTSLPVLPYYSVNFSELNHIVLIIGGETEGISEQCYQLVAQRNGVRLNVPLNNNVDSLNTNTALGIIAFEIKRQLLTLNNL